MAVIATMVIIALMAIVIIAFHLYTESLHFKIKMLEIDLKWAKRAAEREEKWKNIWDTRDPWGHVNHIALNAVKSWDSYAQKDND